MDRFAHGIWVGTLQTPFNPAVSYWADPEPADLQRMQIVTEECCMCSIHLSNVLYHRTWIMERERGEMNWDASSLEGHFGEKIVQSTNQLSLEPHHNLPDHIQIVIQVVKALSSLFEGFCSRWKKQGLSHSLQIMTIACLYGCWL